MKIMKKTRAKAKAGIKVKTRVRSGRLSSNHNATKAGVKVRTKIRSGRLAANHSGTVLH